MYFCKRLSVDSVQKGKLGAIQKVKHTNIRIKFHETRVNRVLPGREWGKDFCLALFSELILVMRKCCGPITIIFHRMEVDCIILQIIERPFSSSQYVQANPIQHSTVVKVSGGFKFLTFIPQCNFQTFICGKSTKENTSLSFQVS